MALTVWRETPSAVPSAPWDRPRRSRWSRTSLRTIAVKVALQARPVKRALHAVVNSQRMRVLLTNDDGIDAEGLQRLRVELLHTPGVDLAVIAPDGNRSAIGRGITTRRALSVERIDFDDGTCGYATDGTPVDCVRLASLGLVEGWTPELVVAGINHGANLGDDVTYSGTVAAAMEGLVLGLPAVAVSQQSLKREMDFRLGLEFAFDAAARFTARVVEEAADGRLGPSTRVICNWRVVGSTAA